MVWYRDAVLVFGMYYVGMALLDYFAVYRDLRGWRPQYRGDKVLAYVVFAIIIIVEALYPIVPMLLS